MLGQELLKCHDFVPNNLYAYLTWTCYVFRCKIILIQIIIL